MHINVKAREGAATGLLSINGKAGGQSWPCALGPAGLTYAKVEGDGATPIGQFELLKVYYRPDREEVPVTDLPVIALTPEDGWCDEPRHNAYNSYVRLPFDASHETLWREDHAYDLCVVLDYNIDPPIPGRGSAIFFHLAKGAEDKLSPTEGCIAISRDAMTEVLAQCQPGTVMLIEEGQ